ncbi:MAG TPA: MFS transporter [Tenuifilaceae bacterium]|nr:MFS transporter [Tenuifilaceae bacterium]
MISGGYKHNIIRLYALKISHWFMLIMPIVVLFYQKNGLSIREVFILQSIYSVAIVALEIPSGYLADAIGRKKTIIIGAVLGFLGFATYSVGVGFITFMIAEIILGIGQSMISGADSALLYDTLIEAQRQDEYLKIEGRMISAGNFSEAVAGVLGGLLAAVNIRYPYYGQTLVALVAIPAAITLVEPAVSESKLGVGWKQILGVVHYSLIQNRRLRWNIIFSSVVGASTLTMAWFVQPWLMRTNVQVEAFGIIWTVLNLLVGISAMLAYKLELKMGRFFTIAVTSIMLAIGFFTSAYIYHLWGLLVFSMFYIARGIATPVLKDGINRISPSHIRATILSVRNFVIRIIFSIWGPFYGWISEQYSLACALLWAGAIFTVLTFIGFFFLRNAELRSSNN